MITSSNAAASLEKENKVELQVEKEQEHPPEQPSLQEFVPKGSEMYEAMEFFLLGSPKRQIAQGGDAETLERSAVEAKKQGNDLTARINYESAAKVALYEANRGEFRKLLELADAATPADQQFSKFHRTLLMNLDKAMEVAKAYYARLEAAGEPD